MAVRGLFLCREHSRDTGPYAGDDHPASCRDTDGRRVHGIVRKTGWAFCSLILTGAFAIFGYSAANPLGVRVIWIVCAAACVDGLLLFIPYKLGDSPEETAAIMSQ